MVELIAVSFVVVPLVLTIAMWVSVSKEPDERAALIRTNATQVTFFATNGYISYHVVRMIIQQVTDANQGVYSDLNPLFLLGIISIFYFLSLLYYKKKIGG